MTIELRERQLPLDGMMYDILVDGTIIGYRSDKAAAEEAFAKVVKYYEAPPPNKIIRTVTVLDKNMMSKTIVSNSEENELNTSDINLPPSTQPSETLLPKPTTVEGWLNLIADDVLREQAFKVCDTTCATAQVDSLSGAIRLMCNWTDTPQGVGYWWDIATDAENDKISLKLYSK